jgi:hypothetical protein
MGFVICYEPSIWWLTTTTGVKGCFVQDQTVVLQIYVYYFSFEGLNIAI